MRRFAEECFTNVYQLRWNFDCAGGWLGYDEADDDDCEVVLGRDLGCGRCSRRVIFGVRSEER